MSKYIRTKNRIYNTYSKRIQLEKAKNTNEIEYYYQSDAFSIPFKLEVLEQADDIAELVDEIVLIENGVEHNIVYLQEAYDRIDEYHNQGNYEPRLIGRIKVGLDKKEVAEWKENEQGLYDWILL